MSSWLWVIVSGKYYAREEKQKKIMARGEGTKTRNTGLIFSNGNWVPVPLDTAVFCSNAMMILQQQWNDNSGKRWLHKVLLISLVMRLITVSFINVHHSFWSSHRVYWLSNQGTPGLSLSHWEREQRALWERSLGNLSRKSFHRIFG